MTDNPIVEEPFIFNPNEPQEPVVEELSAMTHHPIHEQLIIKSEVIEVLATCECGFFGRLNSDRDCPLCHGVLNFNKYLKCN